MVTILVAQENSLRNGEIYKCAGRCADVSVPLSLEHKREKIHGGLCAKKTMSNDFAQSLNPAIVSKVRAMLHLSRADKHHALSWNIKYLLQV